MRRKTVPKRRGDGVYEYLQLVESFRKNGKPRQRVLATLGRIEGRSPDELIKIADALIRFARKQAGKGEDRNGLGATEEVRRYGEVAVLRELWESLGLDKIFRDLAKERRFKFSLPDAVFAMVAHRLVEPGSKLACARWLREEVYLPQAEGLTEDHLYSALTWLEGVMEKVEVQIFENLKQRGLCTPVAFFYDTTVTWFEGRGPLGLAQFGRPKGGQPRGRRQILVSLVRSAEGWPITHDVLPGNRADVTTVTDIIDTLRWRFGVRHFVFVADRGMVSEEVIRHLEAAGLHYVLATRHKSEAEVRDQVLGRAGRYRKVHEKLEVKEVWIDGRRYIVCRNPQSVRRDRKRRQDILAQLKKKLGAKGVAVTSKMAADLRANAAFNRYLKVRNGRLTLDRARAKTDQRYDGKWVLRSNLPDKEAAELAGLYKEQGRIEADFRDLKSFIELRPVYHYTEPRVRAHVFVCVLAKLLMVELERRLGKSGTKKFTVRRALEILKQVHATRIHFGSEDRWLRTQLNDNVRQVLAELDLPARAFPTHLATVPA